MYASKGRWLGLVFGVCALLGTLPGAQGQTLKVAAAANLQKVMVEKVIPGFERATGAKVTVTFGSTKLLAVQLENGAPVDVFVSADTATVQQLAARGVLDAHSVRAYAVGRLVLWTRADSGMKVQGIGDLALGKYRKIALANPALAPYGLTAQQSLAAAGLTAKVAGRLAVAENVGQALQYAQSGNADVAFTALSLVIEDKHDPYIVVPERLHAPIVQSAGVVKGASQAGLGAKFVAYLTNAAVGPVWKRYGYGRP